MTPATPSVSVEAAGRLVTVTNPDKVMFPERGETKLDLVRYYLAVQDPLMAAIGGRPILMQRFPDGATGPSFFQKRIPPRRPEWLQTVQVATPSGTVSDALVAADIAHVLWAANLACLGFHVWACHADDQEHVNELRIDLDPPRNAGFGMVTQAAFEVKQLLGEFGYTGLPKTTGSRGIHVYVRLTAGWTPLQVRAATVSLARELERRRPDLFTTSWWKEGRGHRVFVDFNQNAPHKTIFGAWSVRARPGAQVSTPLYWEELDLVDPDELTVATVPSRIVRSGDPWAGATPASLKRLLELVDADQQAGLGDAPWPPEYPKMPGEPLRVSPSRARSR